MERNIIVQITWCINIIDFDTEALVYTLSDTISKWSPTKQEGGGERFVKEAHVIFGEKPPRDPFFHDTVGARSMLTTRPIDH